MDNDKLIVKKIIAKSLKIELSEINENSSSKNVEEWDSLGHLTILMNLDKNFKGKLNSISELSDCDSFKKIYKILVKHKILTK